MTIDISVVSGTYNRLSYLQKMVNSIRLSTGSVYGLSYEIVLTDGGSVDGTIEWCKQQPDIKLIEHGKLLGAVKAFNDAAFAAQGQYVVMANDDIEFLNDTLLLAYIYMETRSDCGIGCILQDRGRQQMDDNHPHKWGVEFMPVIRNGKQASEPYGQVCIVPRWLGNEVGWWGDYLKTYGGDNELSSRVYELGYKVSPIPNTKMRDNEANDDLRKINNIRDTNDPKDAYGLKPIRRMHPDSAKWGDKWHKSIGPMRGMTGPIVKDNPVTFSQYPMQKRERILYLPIFELGWQVQKEQKRGLREALAKIGIVEEYDYFGRHSVVGKERIMGELETICYKIQPTLVLTQCHNADIINHNDINKLRANCPDYTKFVNWNGDYWPKQLLDQKGLVLARSFDLMTTVNRDVVEKHQKHGINTKYWQIGFEPDGVGYEPEVFYDVVFLASGYSKKRQELGQFLRDLGINLGLYGSGWGEYSRGENLYNFKEACKVYRGSKLAIGDSQWPDSGFVSNRVMQILAAGNTALCHQWFKGMELLGLIDGKTCIIWNNFSDLWRKIIYYLENEDKRKQIAIAGEKLALDYHSFDVRVKELQEMMNTSEEGWRW